MNRVELIARRRVVREFIKADSVMIAIQRKPDPTATPAGGMVRGEPLTLSPQEARIVLNKRRFNNGIVNSEAGDIPHTDYLLIMEYNKDVAVDDEFQAYGSTYRVTGIYGARIESYLCSIDLLGPENRNA
jgi:hypothetical protein